MSLDPARKPSVMYEAPDTSANKTHLFNWLYGTTVQMAKGAYLSRSEPRPFSLHVGGAWCAHVGGKHVPVFRSLTSSL